MSEPDVHDRDVPEPGVRLRLVLALLRILAGRRGHAAVTWWGAGFAYTLTANRRDPIPLDVDLETGGLHVDEARALLADALTTDVP